MVGGIGGPGGGGKVGGPTTLPAPESLQGPQGTKGASFGESLGSVKSTDATSAPSALDALRSGQIDRGQYIERQVTEATAHLEGSLAPADLEHVRAELRDVLQHDPDLAALVRTAEIGT